MATYREIIYTVLDEIKSTSDDSHITEEHVLFLSDKMRALVLKQEYANKNKEIPKSNYQVLCLDLECEDGIECAGQKQLRSVQEIPDTMTIGTTSVTSVDYFSGNFAYVSNERYKFVGYNSYLKNQIYTTISPDNHLYMKSLNPQLMYLERVKVTGIFEDASKAAELECDDDNCDILDKRYPLEEGLIPTVIELMVKELTGVIYKPKDHLNDAADNLSELASFIRNNVKSDLAKQIS